MPGVLLCGLLSPRPLRRALLGPRLAVLCHTPPTRVRTRHPLPSTLGDLRLASSTCPLPPLQLSPRPQSWPRACSSVPTCSLPLSPSSSATAQERTLELPISPSAHIQSFQNKSGITHFSRSPLSTVTSACHCPHWSPGRICVCLCNTRPPGCELQGAVPGASTSAPLRSFSIS